MIAENVIAALDLPASARVDQRVPKKLLLENGAPTAADKRRINDGIDELRWVAALKPTTIGVPAFRDDAREYLEIAVITAALRADAKLARLTELIHRAIPYPVYLIASQGDTLLLSLAHKRWSLGEKGQTVLEGAIVTAQLALRPAEAFDSAFIAALALPGQPRLHLYALYQGWIDTLTALLAARMTGTFTAPLSPEQAAAARAALTECAELEAQMAAVRSAAAKERQVARHVDLNLELQRLHAALTAARQRLQPGTA